MTLNEERVRLGICIEELGDAVGMSYIELKKVFEGQTSCSEEKRKLIKFFLIKNYSKRIENASF